MEQPLAEHQQTISDLGLWGIGLSPQRGNLSQRRATPWEP